MLDFDQLHRQACGGARLLLPNLRAARLARTKLAQLAREDGSIEQVTSLSQLVENVTDWRTWTGNLWQIFQLEGLEDRILLQPLQEKLIWESVLAADGRLPKTGALLDLCISAGQRVLSYGAQEEVLAERSSSSTEDFSRFKQWFRHVVEHCNRSRLLLPGALEWALADAIRQQPRAGQSLVLCGFTSLFPAQHALLDAFAQAGATILTAEDKSPGYESPVLLRCESEAEEWSVLAAFLQKELAKSAKPSIAVVVPDLSQVRGHVSRVLRKQLSTDVGAAFDEDRQPLWEFSTGQPLAATAIVADALRLLHWTTRELDAEELSATLRSPYLKWNLTAEVAANLDATLLRQGQRMRATWSPRAVASRLFHAAPELSHSLREATQSWPKWSDASEPHAVLADRVRSILRTFGWPGSRTRSSEEYQAVRRWESTLDSLAALDLIQPEASWADFVDRLTQAVRSVPFARENTGAPIQFVTPEESEGIYADAVWIAHADETHFRPTATAHPLLSWRIQQQFGMPGVSPALDQGNFEQSLHALRKIAPAVSFSFAINTANGQQSVAPYVEQLGPLHEANTEASAVSAAALLEDFTDDEQVALPPSQQPVRGGAALLKSQAACAFRAFAELRLNSRGLDVHDLGYDARDRGNLMHRALQLFWERTKDQKRLHALIQDNKLAEQVAVAVDEVMRLSPDAADRWSEQYQQVERQRLQQLLQRWLRMEAERPDFRVEALEQSAVVNVGPLALKVRVDRVDRVRADDGTEYRVFVDYKTGDLNHKRWLGERLDEPQLPLYAATATDSNGTGADVGAIAFGIIRAGDKLEFRSLPPRSALLFQGSRASDEVLDSELADWRATLESLASEFAQGRASVGPKEYPVTCQYCQQRLLCRLNPESLHLEELQAEDES